MSETDANDAWGAELSSVDELVDYFRDAQTAPVDWRVGTEHEKVGIRLADGKRVPYEGPSGIRELLERIAAADDWELVEEGGQPIALSKAGASITLEPGGQIELSGAPLATSAETCEEFNTHVDLVKEVSKSLGIAWLGVGADPFHAVDDIPKMPKARYDIMRAYLPTRGADALHMMHATATVQANFDYADEPDMVAKMRTAMGCTPVISAIFANSSLSEGRANGYVSRRMHTWRAVDPDRCGLLHWVFDDAFGYRAYAEWALDIPMFFLMRGGEYLPAHETTFRGFLERGFAGQRATLRDWDIHLTTLFPEVRLKRFIEVRGADGVKRSLICALPAIWKGLLYDATACTDAWQRVRAFTLDQRESGLDDVAKRGLEAEIAGKPVQDFALELTEISADGLRRIAESNPGSADERRFLDPVFDQIALRKSPGQELVELWEGEWNRSPERLIEYARY